MEKRLHGCVLCLLNVVTQLSYYRWYRQRGSRIVGLSIPSVCKQYSLQLLFQLIAVITVQEWQIEWRNPNLGQKSGCSQDVWGFCRLRRTIAQFTVLFKFVLKTSFGIIEELKAHKPSKLVPASLFLALQHCSDCSIVATFQLPYLPEEAKGSTRVLEC